MTGSAISIARLSNADQTAAENSVTEKDVADKESELDQSKADLENAENKLQEADSAKDQAAKAAEEKATEKTAAEEAASKAATEKQEADGAVAEASETARKAAEDAQSAEDLKNGKRDIKDTVQYKEEQDAKKVMDQADRIAQTAAAEADKASKDAAAADTAAAEAKSAFDSATDDLHVKEAVLTEAAKTKDIAEGSKNDAQTGYDQASDDAASAGRNVSDAENEVKEADENVNAAETAKKEADEAVKTAADALDAARKNAESAVEAEISEAEKDAAAKTAATEAAQKALEAVEENYKKGTLGLIDWMLQKEGLTKDQKQDLNFARQVLVDASQEDFTKWYGGDDTGLPEERGGKVVVIGDEKDATNLDNLLKAIEILKEINEMRAQDDNFTGDLKRNDAYTNFYFMATAEAGAMRGAGLMRHSSLTTSCENLAFGYSDPVSGWYYREKPAFDRIRDELGIKKITSMDDVSKIEEEADKQGIVVGHYTNLFWAKDQVMGTGYTQYKQTYCFNASAASNYTDDSYNRAMHLYTIADFEKLVREYYQSVDKSACEEDLKKAAEEQSKAENNLQTLKDGKEASVETAVQKVKADLAAKESAADLAAQKLTSANESLSSAKKKLEDAKEKKAAADQALQTAQETLHKASEEAQAAERNYTIAEQARNRAGQTVSDAENALKDAMNNKASAASVLAAKRAALMDANKALDDAVSAHSAAEKRLADLTSDDTINALSEKKRLADTALQAALNEQASKAKAAEQADKTLAQAEADEEKAKEALQEAESILEQARLNRDAAKETAARTGEELTALKEKYASVKKAIDARDEAKDKLNQAETALSAAEDALAKARENLAQAKLAKAAAADRLERAGGLSVENALAEDIKDPDFAYLNDYISAVKTADAEVATAQEKLEKANAELSARVSDRDKARKGYIAAIAESAVTQNRGTAIITEPVYHPDIKASAGKLSTEKVSIPVSVKAYSGPEIEKTEPVETGDSSDMMAQFAMLLASAGVMTVTLKKKKENL